MTWNSVWPLGTVSVKTNRTTGNQNTTYIETTMGNSIVGTNTATTRDHFWDVGANEDGRHRFINSPAFTVGAVPADPVVGTGMDAVLYLKTTNTRAEWFQRNASAIWQVTPSVKRGTINVPGNDNYITVTNVPANVYGEILFYTTNNTEDAGQNGFFRSNATIVESWSNELRKQSGTSGGLSLKLGNGAQVSGLNIRVRRGGSPLGATTWNYIITYRSL